ncbi:MAG TPA: ABC transporter ATP-binding protein [Gemmatimonadaceae bacterium]|nr:ABC transporter ATP-binding protein [Gemmatimonadaceae bacterium]
MSALAVRAERLSKRYRIGAPGRPTWWRHFGSSRTPQSRFIDVEALRDVSFSVEEGEVFGIIGRNGAGKSTLLKILSRITSPTSGRALMHGRVASLLEVGTGFHPDLTGRENIYLNGMLLGMPKREVARAFDEICDFAGIHEYIDTPIKRYSSGMQLRLAFAVAAHLAADTMIVDEVLAVGDAEFQAKCTRAMRAAAGRGRTTLFVSHNMAAVENLCGRALLLERGTVAKIGSAPDVVEAYLRKGPEVADGLMVFEATPDTAGNRAARIVRASVAGQSSSSIVQGDDIDIELEIELRERVRRLQLLIWLATVEGQQICAFSNGDTRQEWDLSPGRYVARARLSDVHLLPRSYTLSLQLIVDWGAEVLDDCRDALTFSVLGRDVLGTGVPLLSNRGVTWFPATFTVASVDSAALTG